MPLIRPVVFPLLPMTADGACTCAKGKDCARPGKHPAVLWRELAEGDAVPLPAPGAGYGIRTGARPRGSDLVVVDIDGADAVDAWVELGGGPDTYTVQTSRGLQLYYQHPGFHVPNSQGGAGGLWSNGLKGKEAQAIDIRGDGGYVVGEGSPHTSGATYKVVEDLPPAPLPDWLIAWLRARPAREEIQPSPGDVEGEERERRKAIYGSWLAQDAPPCVAGQGGDLTLFKVVQKGAYDLALPVEDVLELIEEHYDHRCDPPWGDSLEERVLHKAVDAKERSTKPREAPLSLEEEILWQEFYGEVEPTRLAGTDGPKAPGEEYGFAVVWGHWDEEPVPPDYLVDKLLVESKVSMIFAEPGTIKSWTAIDIAACVSAGLPWLGVKPTVQAPTLYVDFEDGQYEFHRRVHLLTGGGNRPDLGYVYAPGNIVEQDWWIRLEKLVQAKNIKLVVIDTLSGATPGIDENDRNAADAVTYAGRLTESTGVTVLFLHHANRAGDIRGTSAFKATVDTLFKLETVSEDQDAGVHKAKLTCVKSGQKKVPAVFLELSDDGLRAFEEEDEKGEGGSGSGEEDEGDRKRSVTELQQEVLLLIESEGPFASVSMIRERVKAKMNTVHAILAELSESGEIYKSAKGWRRDGPGQREARLEAAIRRCPAAGRGRILEEAKVSREFFEEKRREGRIRQSVIGDDSEGFIWV